MNTIEFNPRIQKPQLVLHQQLHHIEVTTSPAPKQLLSRSTLQGTCEGVNVLLFQGYLAATLPVQRG
jgi:shikimate 5-dehydrogenase